LAKTKTIENLFFIYLDIYSGLLPILLFFIFWAKSKSSKGLWVIITYCILFFPINLLLLEDNTATILFEASTIIEFSLFIFFIYLNIENRKAKRAVIVAGILYITFYFVYSFLAKAVQGFDSVPIGVETIIILGFSFYYLYERMNDTTTLFIYNTFQFWVILGIVMYLAGSFFIYIFASYLRNNDINKYWFVTNISSILKNIFFCIAIFIHAKPSKESIQYNLETSRLN
jgi:hypothetical protein